MMNQRWWNLNRSSGIKKQNYFMTADRHRSWASRPIWRGAICLAVESHDSGRINVQHNLFRSHPSRLHLQTTDRRKATETCKPCRRINLNLSINNLQSKHKKRFWIISSPAWDQREWIQYVRAHQEQLHAQNLLALIKVFLQALLGVGSTESVRNSFSAQGCSFIISFNHGWHIPQLSEKAENLPNQTIRTSLIILRIQRLILLKPSH